MGMRDERKMKAGSFSLLTLSLEGSRARDQRGVRTLCGINSARGQSLERNVQVMGSAYWDDWDLLMEIYQFTGSARW